MEYTFSPINKEDKRRYTDFDEEIVCNFCTHKNECEEQCDDDHDYNIRNRTKGGTK